LARPHRRNSQLQKKSRHICHNYAIGGAVVVLAALVAVIITACIPPIEWQTNSQGKLDSIGLPGIPLWQSENMQQQNALARSGQLAAQPGAIVDAAADNIPAHQSDAPWLAEINRWRAATGTAPVGENDALSIGAAKHAEYLIRNGPQASAGAIAHTEQPGNPHYTPDGDQAAHTGDVNNGTCTAMQAIDGWLQVPFHRLNILASWTRVTGYGDYGHCPDSAAVLVVRGAAPVGLTKPVIFPPDGSTIFVGSMESGEWPDPLAASPGYSYPVGLPITVQLGSFVRTQLVSYEITDETTGRGVQACGFDSVSFPGEERARAALTEHGAVVVIPRHPLKAGRSYAVLIQTTGHSFSAHFSVAGASRSVARG
jgi:uncharacterized protein YkwD